MPAAAKALPNPQSGTVAEQEKAALICIKGGGMQQGSIIQTVRKQGTNVWPSRLSEKIRNGRRLYRNRVIEMTDQYPDASIYSAKVFSFLMPECD